MDRHPKLHGATGFLRSRSGPLEADTADVRHRRSEHYGAGGFLCLHSVARRAFTGTAAGPPEAPLPRLKREGTGKGARTAKTRYASSHASQIKIGSFPGEIEP